MFFLMIFSLIGYGQEIAIGQWRDHLPYNNITDICLAGDKVYCVTKAGGLFSYQKESGEIQRLSKISGLSDVGASAIGYDPASQSLLVGYSSGNLDLIKDGKIYNISDIKRKQVSGDPKIYSIRFYGDKAYLGCGFGIVVFNISKMEIFDTYRIGPNGTDLIVYDVITDGSTIFAATSLGFYNAPINEPLLTYSEKWVKIANGVFNTIAILNSSVYTVNFSSSSKIYKYNGIDFSLVDYYPNLEIRKLESSGIYLTIVNQYGVDVLESDLIQKKRGFSSAPFPIRPRTAFFDNSGVLWIGDENSGLIRSPADDSSISIVPLGPPSLSVFDLDAANGMVCIAPGVINSAWNSEFNGEPVTCFIDGRWEQVTGLPENARDLIVVKVNKNGGIFAGSWNVGLLEISDLKVSNVYDSKNSSLKSRSDAPGSTDVQVGGLDFDNDGNLWVANSNASHQFSVYKKNGSWKEYGTKGLLPVGPILGDLMVDQLDQKWLIAAKGVGIVVLNTNQTLDDESDDRVRLLKSVEGEGSLPEGDIKALAVDKEGVVWIGTEKGIVIYSEPSTVFEEPDCQKILITQNGITQYLLESVIVTDIIVDDANRKWIGTIGAGVFYISEDGTKELDHFTTENSPLLSNDIIALALNQKTGELFMGTTKGIISYKGTVTESKKTFTDLITYPNPVRPGYEGLIAIKGLVNMADIKITDISGSLIYQTKSQGGQAVWDGKNYDGTKAQSGVYLVFASNDDGSQKLVSKILIIGE